MWTIKWGLKRGSFFSETSAGQHKFAGRSFCSFQRSVLIEEANSLWIAIISWGKSFDHAAEPGIRYYKAFWWGTQSGTNIQYRHLISAPVDRTSASVWLYKHPWITCHKNKYINDPRSLQFIYMFSCVVRNGQMHPCPENCVAIGRAVVYYALAAHAFSAGIKCRHCSTVLVLTHLHSEWPKEAWQFWKYFNYKSIFLKTFEG